VLERVRGRVHGHVLIHLKVINELRTINSESIRIRLFFWGFSLLVISGCFGFSYGS
jgi:hypothetical protein